MWQYHSSFVSVGSHAPTQNNKGANLPSVVFSTAAHLSCLMVHCLLQGLSGALVMTLFQGLAWNDTMACFKCIKLCWPAVRQLLQVPGRVTGPDAQLLLEAVLRGLQQHGEHEGNQAALIALALTLYEHLVSSAWLSPLYLLLLPC